MRKFYLQNEYGEKRELQDGSVFFWKPNGLGMSDTASYKRADYFHIQTSNAPSAMNISGTLVFIADEPYWDYREFVTWLITAKSLTLGYTADVERFCIDVALESIDKSELTTYGVLEAPVSFKALSPWYSPRSINLNIGGKPVENAKRYPYPYPYRYANANKEGSITFTVRGQVPAAFTLSVPGAIDHPIITLKRADTNKIIGRVDLSGLLVKKDETLEYSSLPNNTGVWLDSANGKVDLVNYIELDSELPTFFSLPIGLPLELSLGGASVTGLSANMTIRSFYRTV